MYEECIFLCNLNKISKQKDFENDYLFQHIDYYKSNLTLFLNYLLLLVISCFFLKTSFDLPFAKTLLK